MALKDTIVSAVTGDAYKNPAKTADGAFTKQGEHNAHTIEGTSADPNSTGSKTGDAIEKAKEVGSDASNKAQDVKGQAEQKGSEAKADADKSL